MTTETMTCTCSDCSHELRTDCLNMQCSCCVRQDAEDLLTHIGGKLLGSAVLRPADFSSCRQLFSWLFHDKEIFVAPQVEVEAECAVVPYFRVGCLTSPHYTYNINCIKIFAKTRVNTEAYGREFFLHPLIPY